MKLTLNAAEIVRQRPVILLVGGPYDARTFEAYRRVDVGSVIQVAAETYGAVHNYLVETRGTATYTGLDESPDTEGMVEVMLSAPASDPTK